MQRQSRDSHGISYSEMGAFFCSLSVISHVPPAASASNALMLRDRAISLHHQIDDFLSYKETRLVLQSQVQMPSRPVEGALGGTSVMGASLWGQSHSLRGPSLTVPTIACVRIYAFVSSRVSFRKDLGQFKGDNSNNIAKSKTYLDEKEKNLELGIRLI